MSADHYVSQFHLREFCDPASAATPNPWLWVGDLANGSVKRRSPKNVGTAPSLFQGPGGLTDPTETIETFLANEVEGPAAFALRALRDAPSLDAGRLPPDLIRYLAWAAARSLPVQTLETEWADRFGGSAAAPLVEAPPDGLTATVPRLRPVRLLHRKLGERTLNVDEDPTALLDAGWIPDMTERDNFLESVHVQAFYFQTRWFPRLKWFTLRPPRGSCFVIGDRPVGWGVPDCLDAPPSCLRDPDAFLMAPLLPSLALVGRNLSAPWAVTPEHVNAVLAAWSHDWIAGPTPTVVAEAIRDRGRLTSA